MIGLFGIWGKTMFSMPTVLVFTYRVQLAPTEHLSTHYRVERCWSDVSKLAVNLVHRQNVQSHHQQVLLP